MPQYTRLDVPKASLKLVINYTPTNVFIVNTLNDANRALNFVKAFKWNDMDCKSLNDIKINWYTHLELLI